MSTMQTLCLLFEKDIVKFGLKECLKVVMEELKSTVINGIFDKQLNKTLQVRVIVSLGDNLGTIHTLRYLFMYWLGGFRN